MSPNDATPSTPPVAPPPSVSPPVFHNPLVDGYTPPMPQPESAPAPASTTPAQDFATELPPEPLPVHPPADPSVLDLQDLEEPHPPVIQAAPVRLAPVPKGNDVHAQGLAESAYSQPFSNVPAPHVAEAALMPLVPHKKKSSHTPLIIMLVLVLVGGLVLGAWYLSTKLPTAQKGTSTSTPTPASQAKRDTSRKNLPLGYAQVETECYYLQVPENPEIQVNKDCRLAVAYGATKSSTVVVSPYKDFDLVGADPTADQGKAQKFDSGKILEGLISSTTAGRTVAERQDIKVGNIDTVKVTSTSSSNGEVVAYAFIVLPDADQSFEEKKFIAFIVTGAYNDEASRTAFDNLLKNWQWK